MFLLLIIAIILGNPISIILILFCIHEDISECDHKISEYNKDLRHLESERNKDRRHNEYMEELERHHRRTEPTSRRIRNVARDERGRFIAQEIEEEYED